MKVESTPSGEKSLQRSAATRLHADAVVCDLALPWTNYGRQDLREETLPRFAASGVNFVSMTLATDAESQPDVFRTIARERRNLLSQPNRFQLVESAADILKAKAEGRLAVSFNFQGTNAFAGNLDMVETFHRLGVRQALMAYNKKNAVGDGCHERTDAGLSHFGVELVQEMNRVGMIVDCSHTGFRTSMEVMEVSSQPVIFSHSNPRSLWEHDRNIRDEQATACAKTGGLIGVVGVDIFMGESVATIERVFRQIDYYAALIGTAHIGLGLDYVYDIEDMQRYMRGVKSPARGNYARMRSFFEPEQLPGLTEVMLANGYSDAGVREILGENFLRVARAVWR